MALLSRYKLDEKTGTIARDSVGSVDGSIVGGTVIGDIDTPGIGNGTSFNFDGVDDSVNFGTGDFNFERTDTFSLAAWVKCPDSVSDAFYIVGKNETSGDFKGYGLFVAGSGGVNINLNNSVGNRISGSSTVFVDDDLWHHVVATYDGSSTVAGATIYIDGVDSGALTVFADTLSLTILHSAKATIGARDGTGIPFDGNIDDVRIYDTELTAGEVTAIYEEVKPANLVGYYKLDETAGTTALDSSATPVNGTIAGSPTLGSDDRPGLGNSKSMVFDGVNDAVNFGTGDYKFERTDTFSLSAWINTTNGSGQEIFSTLESAGNFRGYSIAVASNVIDVNFINSFGPTVALQVRGTAVVNDGAWHHVLVTYDGSSLAAGVNIYIDGVADTLTTLQDTLTLTMVSGTSVTSVGSRNTTTLFFNGDIDEVRIYDTELTAAEVTAIYKETIFDDPVGYYKLDEILGTIAKDSSTSLVDGTIVGGTALGDVDTPGVGNGTSMLFDGTNDGINLGTAEFGFERSNPFSVSSWINVSSLGIAGQIAGRIQTGGNFIGWRILVHTNARVSLIFISSPGSRVEVDTPISVISTDQWYHVVFTYDGSSTAAGVTIYLDNVAQAKTIPQDNLTTSMTAAGVPATIGMYDNQFGTFFNGNIDDVRIYNRELTSGEVTTLYEEIKPSNLVGYYKLDETSGTTALDSSATPVNGTIAGSPTLGDIDTPGVSVGRSMVFDGVNDSVNLGTGDYSFERTDTFSLSVWMKTASAVSHDVIGKGDSTSPFQGYLVRMSGSTPGQLIFNLANTFPGNNVITIRSTATVDDDVWHHIVVTYDGSSTAAGASIYIDGALAAITVDSDTLSSSIVGLHAFSIGSRDAAGFFNGNIDEARIYDTELTAGEVSALYKETIPNNLVGYYRLDETSGTTAVAQVGPTGTIVGGPTLAQTGSPGSVKGTSILFDGVNDHIDFGTNDFNFERTDSFSVSAWVKSSVTNNGDIFSTLENTGNSRGYGIRLTAGEVSFNIISDAGAGNRLQTESTTLIDDDVWHHVVCTYDASSTAAGAKIYVDGSVEPFVSAFDNLTTTIVSGASTPSIGSRNALAVFFTGNIDEVRIYDKELASSEVSELYLSGQVALAGQEFLDTLSELLDWDTILTGDFPFKPEVLEGFSLTLNPSAFQICTNTETEIASFNDILSLDFMEFLIDQFSLQDTVLDIKVLDDILTDVLSVSDTETDLLINLSSIIDIFSLHLNFLPTGDITLPPIQEDFSLNDTISVDVLRVLREIFSVSDDAITRTEFGITVKDFFSLSTLFNFFFNGSASETIELNSTLLASLTKIGSLTDGLKIAGVVSENEVALNILIEAVDFLATAFNVQTSTIIEQVSISDLIAIAKIFAKPTITEDFSISDLQLDNIVFTLGLTDKLSLDDTLDSNAVLRTLCEDGLAFLFVEDLGGIEYEGWVMNTDTFSMWNYEDFNFNSMDQLGQDTLLASSSGLYKMQDNKDELAFIISKIQTAAMDLGNSNRKQMHKVYLGLLADKELILIVKLDDKVEATYRSQIQLSNSDTPFIDLGKGLTGRTWQFELQDKDATQFDLSDIELYPIVWNRKRR